MAKNDRLWCMARALRVVVLVVWWLGCGVDADAPPGPPDKSPPTLLSPADCDRLGREWVTTSAGGFCRSADVRIAPPSGQPPDGGADR